MKSYALKNLNVTNSQQVSRNPNTHNGNGNNNLLTKNTYNSNHHLNYYAKNGNTNHTSRINNSMSINQLNSNSQIANGQMQSYQSMSQIAMNGAISRNPTGNNLLMKPLNRNSRRASMSELGYGKIESYMKLEKLGEVS